jgi:O-antigen ligase
MSVLFDVRGIPFPRGGSAAGLYMSIPTLWVAARLAYGLPLHRLEIVVGVVGLLGVGLTDQRGNWLALAAGLAVLALLAPADRRMRAAAVTAAAVVAMGAGTIGVESVVSAAGATPAHQASDTSGSESGGGDRGSQATRELSGIAGGETAEGSNSEWRLAIWGYSLERMVESPLGISLGRPLAYEWKGRQYDFRTGRPGDQLDVTGPHNSFVEIGARMGIAGFVALIAIVAYAGWRGFGVVRDRATESDDRFLAAAMLAVVACGVVIASFNDALKGPYHGLFFWLPIGLLLIAPFVLRAKPKSPMS